MRALPLSHSTVRPCWPWRLRRSCFDPSGRPCAPRSRQPSLAELARKEAERRKTTKESKKVITAKDLPESAAQAGLDASGERSRCRRRAHGGAAPASEHGAAAAGGRRQKPRRRGTTRKGRSRLARPHHAGARDVAAQRGLPRGAADPRRTPSTTTPAMALRSSTSRPRSMRTGRRRPQEMERVKADIESSKKHVADIEEEARKAGVPPGWLR